MTPVLVTGRLAFVPVKVCANGQSVTLNRVLLDTSSAGTAFKTDQMEKIGICLELADRIVFMRGVGGEDPVVQKRVEAVEVGDLIVSRGLVINRYDTY